VKVGEPVNFTENDIVAEFEHPVSCGPCGARVRNHLINAFFWHPAAIKNCHNFSSGQATELTWSLSES
jgi:hypothetical protein